MKHAVVLSLALALACSTAQTGPVDETRALRYGQTVTIGGAAITFSAVEDSRCPSSVTCVWAGDAAVTLESNGSRVTLHTNQVAGSRSGQLGTLNVTLVDVAPVRVNSEPPQKTEYTSTIRVTR